MKDDVLTPQQWKALMEAIALDGVRVPVALKCLHIRPCVFRRLIKAEPQLHAHFVRAKRRAKRRRFPFSVVEEMISELARTNASFKEIVLRRGYSLTGYKRLVDLIYRLPDWKQAYLSARDAKVLRNRTQLLDVSDDALVSMGKSGISRAVHQIGSMASMRDRRATAKQYRAERAAQDPLYAARQRAHRQGK
jgi:hypothetical protein